VVRIDTPSGGMTGYSKWPAGITGIGGSAFAGGVFDGTAIWLVPSNADRLVRIDARSGNMTGYRDWPAGTSSSVGNAAFAGGLFDGSSIWLVPFNSNRPVAIRLNCSAELQTPTVTSTTSWSGTFSTQSSSLPATPTETRTPPVRLKPNSRPWTRTLSVSSTVQRLQNFSRSISLSRTASFSRSGSPVPVQVATLDPLTKASVVVSATATTAASGLASINSAGGSGTDLQTLFILGTFRCNSSFLKGLSDEGDAAIVPLRVGPKPLDGLLGMATIQGVVLVLHLTIAAMAFRLMRWESLSEGLRRTGFPSFSIAFCFSLHQGTFFEALRLWAGEVPATAGELGGSIGLFIVVMGPPLWITIWAVTALRESFVRYRLVFRSMPAILKSAVLPVGYWTAEQPISAMLRSGFGSYVARSYCLFGLTGMVRAFVTAAVSVLGKKLDCAAQTWIVAGTLVGTALLSLILRPFNTRLTVILTTLSSLLTATVTVLSQFSGMDKVVQWLTVALSGTTLVGTVLLLIVKLLTNRWLLLEKKLLVDSKGEDTDPAGIPLRLINSTSSLFAFRNGASPSSTKPDGDDPQPPNSFQGPTSLSSPLLQVPIPSSATTQGSHRTNQRGRPDCEGEGAGYNPLLSGGAEREE
jgi:hypothetical protein